MYACIHAVPFPIFHTSYLKVVYNYEYCSSSSNLLFLSIVHVYIYTAILYRLLQDSRLKSQLHSFLMSSSSQQEVTALDNKVWAGTLLASYPGRFVGGGTASYPGRFVGGGTTFLLPQTFLFPQIGLGTRLAHCTQLCLLLPHMYYIHQEKGCLIWYVTIGLYIAFTGRVLLTFRSMTQWSRLTPSNCRGSSISVSHTIHR